jgi:gliding motility-associated protein GldL
MLGALEPQHLHTDWSKVYPELAHSEEEEENMDEFLDEGSADDEDVTEQITATTNESGDGLTQQLDKMLADAKIGPELMESLGLGLKGLADQTNKLSDITDASAATKDYVDSVRTASQNVDSLSETYAKASDALVGLANDNREGASFGEQLSKMSQNLSELNTTYELQLQGAKESVENSGKYFTGVDELLASLSNSVEDAKKYSEGIHQLSSNINQLNTIYGNMLGAMNPNNNG